MDLDEIRVWMSGVEGIKKIYRIKGINRPACSTQHVSFCHTIRKYVFL